MKKTIALLLCMGLVFATVSAFAASGTVNGPLRLRKNYNSTATIIGWLKDGDTVTINGAPATGWYAVTGTAYQYNNYTGWVKPGLSGYVMSQYIY